MTDLVLAHGETIPAGGKALSEVEAAAWRGLLRAHSRLMREVDSRLSEEHGLSLNSFEVLDRLAASSEGRMRMSDLAAAARVTRSGATRLVERLEAADLVTRESPSHDPRSTFAVLTEAGQRRLRQTRPTYVTALRGAFTGRLSEDEMRTLAQIWRRLD